VIVADASALLEILLRTARSAAAETRLFGAQEPLHAPHLVDVEIVQVIRRFAAMGEIEEERAREALADFLAFPISRHPHGFLLPRAWDLRGNFSAYDAMYVALADSLDATLVTHDRRLATAARRHVAVELV